MSGCKKLSMPRQSSYNSLYVNPLNDHKHNRSCSEGFTGNKENKAACFGGNKENAKPTTNGSLSLSKMNQNMKSLSTNSGSFDMPEQQASHKKSLSTGKILKPSSLEFCMRISDPDKAFGSNLWNPIESENSGSLKIWDYSDNEAAPASSWSTLPNRVLLCRPLPIDIGRCTCVIVKEALPKGCNGGTLYSLYTYEGQGRQDRKLAVAHHKRHNGKSEFAIAQNTKGILSNSDDSFVGIVTSNLMGSKYNIWNQGRFTSLNKQSNSLLAAVRFIPTIATCAGTHRSMRAYIPKHQSMLLKNTSQVQHINGLPEDWEGKVDKVHQLCSRIPQYNNMSKQFELDFRDRGRAGLRIQSSVKNFQLTQEENGRQTILQLGRVNKSKFVMDFRYPLTGYQAFCICLTSIDSKLCCSV
ncbi:Tub domain-containing protein [Cephalotus follicularis]|uniref:Tub domain-containing protein n=1 Tax=Cephalotus follicularis TaxID=3775 RepID=A0A1Q3DGU7_CEPFO|nr:Tub domain-containing protein [Cephalotus follicularis]